MTRIVSEMFNNIHLPSNGRSGFRNLSDLENRSSTARTWKLINKLPGTAVHPPILKNGG